MKLEELKRKIDSYRDSIVYDYLDEIYENIEYMCSNPKEYLTLSFSTKQDEIYDVSKKHVESLTKVMESIGFTNISYNDSEYNHLDYQDMLRFTWPENLVKEYKIQL